MLGPTEDVGAVFAAVWPAEQDAALAVLCADEKLNPDAIGQLVGRMVYTGKKSLGDEITAAIIEPLSILKRRATVDRILFRMRTYLQTFEDAVGELSDKVDA